MYLWATAAHRRRAPAPARRPIAAASNPMVACVLQGCAHAQLCLAAHSHQRCFCRRFFAAGATQRKRKTRPLARSHRCLLAITIAMPISRTAPVFVVLTAARPSPPRSSWPPTASGGAAGPSRAPPSASPARTGAPRRPSGTPAEPRRQRRRKICSATVPLLLGPAGQQSRAAVGGTHVQDGEREDRGQVDVPERRQETAEGVQVRVADGAVGSVTGQDGGERSSVESAS